MPAQLPLFTPDAPWRPPTELPDLRKGAKYIAVDTETHDPLLEEQGPGFIRGDAYVCGISLANDLGAKLYLPIAHADDNMDRELVIRYARDMLSGDQEKCGANLMYDMESLWSLGIELKGKLSDIQVAEPLLDEERPGGYSLNKLALSYLGVAKNEQLLREMAAAYGVDPKKGMKDMPGRAVGPYAEDDAILPVEIFKQQIIQLEKEKLLPVFELERELQYALFAMRLRGIRVDLDEAEKLSKMLDSDAKIQYDQLQKDAERPFDPDSTRSLAPILRAKGIQVPVTLKGNPSITSPWLEQQRDPFCKSIIRWRRTVKMRKDFVEGLILNFNVKGRLHPQWHQLRQPKFTRDESSDEVRGVRGGRISSSKPNLTVIPSRENKADLLKFGNLIRGLFLPDEGCFFGKKDYSQQEPRFLLHYAYRERMPGAAEARQRYIDDPSTDYHQLVCDLIKEKTGQDIGRRNAKEINLGAAYGMGKDKLALKLGLELEQAISILSTYHQGVPYVRKLERHITKIVEQQGFVRTFLGRKRRFQLWEPADGFTGEDWEHKMAKPMRWEEAKKWFGHRKLIRSYAHKALNAVMQGGAGDQMKTSIILLHRERLTPQIQVYDELDSSYASMADLKRATEIMTTAIELTVPFLVEPETGPSWGNLTKLKGWDNEAA